MIGSASILEKPNQARYGFGGMHSRISCRCPGVIALPSSAVLSFGPASQAMSPAAAVAATGHALLQACSSNNSSASSMRAAETAKDKSNAARVFFCSRYGAGSFTAASEAGGRCRIDRSSSSRAALQESSNASVVVERGAAATENGSHQSSVNEQHPSDYIGFGSLLENGSFFRERFVIRFSEAGHRGTITLETLSSLLQEAATNHVIAMDYEFTPGNLDGNITVITRMHIEVDQYPAWRDLLEIDTWFQREGKNAVRRDWIVKNVKTGQKIAFATSTWVLMNTNTRRLTKLTEEQWTELEPHLRRPATWALSEERRDNSSTKISKLGDNATHKIRGLIASEKDTDMNQHVNNIRYMVWMLESIPEELKIAFEVSKITLEYRQEAIQGQEVESVAEAEEPKSSTTKQFTHLIKTSEKCVLRMAASAPRASKPTSQPH